MPATVTGDTLVLDDGTTVHLDQVRIFGPAPADPNGVLFDGQHYPLGVPFAALEPAIRAAVSGGGTSPAAPAVVTIPAVVVYGWAKELAPSLAWVPVKRVARFDPITGARTLLGAGWLRLDGSAYGGAAIPVDGFDSFTEIKLVAHTVSTTFVFGSPVSELSFQSQSAATVTVECFARADATGSPLATIELPATAQAEFSTGRSLVKAVTFVSTVPGAVYVTGSRPA
jgi:hypothetical protein